MSWVEPLLGNNHILNMGQTENPWFLSHQKLLPRFFENLWWNRWICLGRENLVQSIFLLWYSVVKFSKIKQLEKNGSMWLIVCV